MALRLITAPAEGPVTLAEAKAHLRVTHTSDDTGISALIDAATGHIDGPDGTLGRALVTQTWELVVDAFPSGAMRLPLPPLQSVTSVTYIDPEGVTQVMPASDYVVDTANQPGWVVPVDTWPSTGDTPNAVKVRFVAGYGAAADVPAPLKHAVLLMVGGHYLFRESMSEGAVVETPAVKALLRPYRVWRV